MQLRASGHRVVDHFDALWNAADAKKFAEAFAADGTFQDPFLASPLRGRGTIREYLNGYFGAFPDIRVETRVRFADDRHAMLRVHVHQSMMGILPAADGSAIPPTNKVFEGDLAMHIQFDRAGRIQDLRVFGDSADLLRQIGLYR